MTHHDTRTCRGAGAAFPWRGDTPRLTPRRNRQLRDQTDRATAAGGRPARTGGPGRSHPGGPRRGTALPGARSRPPPRAPPRGGRLRDRGAVPGEAFGDSVTPARAVRQLVARGQERTIDQDPAFAIRVLVDIAIKALSPAVNDPTTAVQVSNYLEQHLQVAAAADLSYRYGLDATGTLRALVPGRGRDDYLALAVTEIRECGADSYRCADGTAGRRADRSAPGRGRPARRAGRGGGPRVPGRDPSRLLLSYPVRF
ncbi:DUF2254 family protein [Streptomyces sp. NPDC052015]|uniref:DUF2254 family protein n=1 Tax=Streptomyces sp. NPDC052015 TaxID=3154755 RepID=UPI003420BA22